ncbi:DUF2871 domain-containing protein [Amycolatopsis cynarae]|uniref:DUF2871 domain-containing protein n=1 Tax=Amycolatopsis cynarae TaxID=2995223 RepID=A0ABY7BA79_9PSEU|nr:DUF2871 domain-containing protein [Amycolatopsis sp. HUAS 11-8]WAL69265.1 DUF2871 domain-containing protein [Amycolatopsis sp. HUAS 11-8]
MKKSYWAALVYLVLGLAGGFYYRELTKAHNFTGETQLSVVHTHLLALGMLLFLIVLALDVTLKISQAPAFKVFFWTYNAGLALTVAMMLVHGTLTVLGKESGAAIAGIAGLGHIGLTVGLAFLFVAIGKALPKPQKETEKPVEEPAEA